MGERVQLSVGKIGEKGRMKTLLRYISKQLSPLLKWINPFFDLKKCILAFVPYVDFFRDLNAYKKIPGAENVFVTNIWLSPNL